MHTCRLIWKAIRWVCEIPCCWWGGQGHRVKVKITKRSTLMSSVQPKENAYYRYEDSTVYRSRITGKREVCRKVYLRTNIKTECWIKLIHYVLNHLISGQESGGGHVNRFCLLKCTTAFGLALPSPLNLK